MKENSPLYGKKLEQIYQIFNSMMMKNENEILYGFIFVLVIPT